MEEKKIAYWKKSHFNKITWQRGIPKFDFTDEESWDLMKQYPKTFQDISDFIWYCSRKFHSLEELKMVLSVEGYDDFRELHED